MRTAVAILMVSALALSGCSATDDADESSDPGGSSNRFTVVTDMYPTTYAVQQVVGDDVEVIQLAPTGVEPHDYELSPGQVRQIADADLVAYLPDLIPAVQQAAEQEAGDRALDVTEGITRLEGPAEDHAEDEEHGDEEHGEDGDPHVWLDPRNMARMASNVAGALSARGVAADSAQAEQALADLHEEFATGLARCDITTMVVSHAAFGYLADAYGFTQVGISGLSPEAEPSPRKLAEISQLVEAEGITTIFFEALASPDAAQAIAAETGATTALLDPIEGSTDGQPYDAIMRANLAALSVGQACS
jgi:zinc transport system substrate-binding protein